MNTTERARIAARVKNEKYARIRLEKYLSNPNKCKFCGKDIIPKARQNLCEISKKKFCNRACFGKSKIKVETPKTKVQTIRLSKLWDMTKGDLKKLGNYHARIRENARTMFKRVVGIRPCEMCGYRLHTEICHIKSIESFSDEAKISEINSVNNLLSLCPTHHWEFDKGIIQYEAVRQGRLP